eukprot:1954586-Alexandrium_andersonii.AAC.1
MAQTGEGRAQEHSNARVGGELQGRANGGMLQLPHPVHKTPSQEGDAQLPELGGPVGVPLEDAAHSE